MYAVCLSKDTPREPSNPQSNSNDQLHHLLTARISQAVLWAPVPVLPGLAAPGDAVVGSTPVATSSTGSTGGDPRGGTVGQYGGTAKEGELERWCVEELIARAKDAYPILNTSGRMFWTVGALIRMSCSLACSDAQLFGTWASRSSFCWSRLASCNVHQVHAAQ